MWFEVSKRVSETQKEIYMLVEEMCRMVEEDIKPLLEELKSRYRFTYVIEPVQRGSDITGCVPCLCVEADEDTYQAVKKAITASYGELVSEARLAFEKKPRQPEI